MPEKTKYPPYKKLMIILFAAILILLPILTFILMPREAQPFEENENRYLAKFPAVSLENVKDKTFMNGFDEWFSDRFVDRIGWITVRNNTEKLLGKTEIKGVFTEDDRMMMKWSGYDTTVVNRTLDAMESFAERHSSVPMFFMLVPSAQEIYSDTLPEEAIIGDQKKFIEDCYGSLSSIAGIDVYSSLQQNREKYIYYRTDHHWTSLGAYLAYFAAGGKLGYTPYEIGSFNIEHASSDFRGTLYSKTLDKGVTPDIVDFYTLTQGDPLLKLSINSGKGVDEYDSLYFREFLEVKDKYSAFMGQNSPIMEIETDLADNDRSILIIKDSYAHSLIPFLSKHFSRITVLDMRYINTSYRSFVNVEDYSEVLFIGNVITFSEDTNIKKLNLGK